jgi:hypothetical protein
MEYAPNDGRFVGGLGRLIVRLGAPRSVFERHGYHFFGKGERVQEIVGDLSDANDMTAQERESILFRLFSPSYAYTLRCMGVSLPAPPHFPTPLLKIEERGQLKSQFMTMIQLATLSPQVGRGRGEGSMSDVIQKARELRESNSEENEPALPPRQRLGLFRCQHLIGEYIADFAVLRKLSSN